MNTETEGTWNQAQHREAERTESKAAHKLAGHGGRRQRRSVAAVLAILVAATLLLPAAYGTTETAKLQKRAELVVFIRFAGEPEFVSGTTTDPIITLEDESQIRLNDWYNSAAMDRVKDPSVNQYVQKITYGGTLVKPIYASASADGMASYECEYQGFDADFSKDNREWFQEVQRQALLAVKANLPEGAELDYDDDGTIDNVMFLWGASDNRSWINWLVTNDNSRAHKSSFDTLITINGKWADDYVRNFIYGKSSWAALAKDFDKQTLVHEYMHTLGVPDLYSENGIMDGLYGTVAGSGIPVGQWDIQSSGSDYGSTFLSQRMKYMGIGTFGEITKSGTYALYDVNDPNPPNGINGYKIPTNRANEYFAIEYRRGVTDSAAKEDGDGILVYRVKTDKRGNVKGEEEVHLFGETAGLNSTASIANSKDGIGNPKSGGILTNNELEFTDDTNSGIYIRNVGKAGETITFEVYVP